MILTLNMKDIMLGVLSPRGGGGDWIAADETRLYLRDGFISYKHTHTHIHTDTHEYMHECVCVSSENIDTCVRTSGTWHDAIFDGWQRKVWEAARFEIAGVRLTLRHTLKPLSFQAMPFAGKYQSVEIYYSG